MSKDNVLTISESYVTSKFRQSFQKFAARVGPKHYYARRREKLDHDKGLRAPLQDGSLLKVAFVVFARRIVA